MTHQPCKVISLYGGPGTGKSTTAAGVFSKLKLLGINCEYVQEYAKDKAWEFGNTLNGTPKVFRAQEYIFAKQHFRMRRCAEDVDLIVTDCPLLLSLIYMPEDFDLPSLRSVILDAYNLYDNFNVFLSRVKGYNPKGRFQSEDKARELDEKILTELIAQRITVAPATADDTAVDVVVTYAKEAWPTLFNN